MRPAQHPDRPRRAPRRGRRAAGAVVAALLVALVVPGPAHAAPVPPDGTVVLATDVDRSPAGTLATTTVGLGLPADGARASGASLPAGWRTTVAVPAGTQQVGLSWSGDPRARFQVRGRTPTGAWSATATLAGDPEEGPERTGPRAAAGPVWLGSGGVTEVEVRLAEGRVADVRLDAMAFRTSGATADGEVTTRDGQTTRAITIARPATPAGGPPIRLRSSWAPGGWAVDNAGCGPAPQTNVALRHAVVHHTDTPNAYAQADVPAMLAGIYRFHTGTRGWCDIAYNLFVDRFGGVWEGRSGGLDQAISGGHAMGFNSSSVGIALLGSHQTGGTVAATSPSAATLASLREVLAWKLGSQGIDATARVTIASAGNTRYAEGVGVSLATVSGHGDSTFSSCPGDLVRSRLARLRTDVAGRIAATNDPTRWRPHGTGARYWARVIHDAEGSVDRPSRIGAATSEVVRAGRNQGELTAATVLSGRTDGRIGMVDRFYRAAFGRSPDSSGLLANVRHRDAGMAPRDLARNFLISSEFARRHGAPDDAAFTALLYRNALGREASPAALADWGARLAGGVAREDMLVQFSESAEHRARRAVETRVTTAFFVMVRRVPSEASRRHWEPRLRSGTPDRDLVVGLLRSADYLARF